VSFETFNTWKFFNYLFYLFQLLDEHFCNINFSLQIYLVKLNLLPILIYLPIMSNPRWGPSHMINCYIYTVRFL